jgi:hypothetical protein
MWKMIWQLVNDVVGGDVDILHVKKLTYSVS